MYGWNMEASILPTIVGCISIYIRIQTERILTADMDLAYQVILKDGSERIYFKYWRKYRNVEFFN